MSAGPASVNPATVAPYMFSLMLRNIATFGFMIADHNDSGDPGGYTAPGCVLASPSWPSYPGNVAPIIEDYVFNWTRDAAITMSAVLNQAPGQIPAAGASDLLASYVNFASTCQASGGDIGQAHYTPEGASTNSIDESDGPALRILTLLQGFAGLDGPTQTVARNVIAADLGYLLDNNHYQSPTTNLWEDTFGQSIFARSVQLAALNQVISRGPSLGIPLPPTAPAAAAWLGQQLPLHWSDADNYYVGVLDATRGGGDPPALYDPSIDPILACIYGAGIPPYDPRLLSTAAQVRAQWTAPAPTAYPINSADQSIGIGPCIGRYNGDEYSGWSLTSNTGHPWVVCTCGFAQLYYELAAAINNGTTSVPTDPLATTFLNQISLSSTSTAGDALSKLQAAGDSMLQAVLYHSNRYELSEQFDQSSGYEISVSNLTWSYAAYLSAVAAR
jgi:glucoamylase